MINNKLPENTVIVCIGSANVFLDSLAPRVGTKLKELGCPFAVYGTMDNPINGSNCEEIIPEIKKMHPDNFIVGIDAALSTKEDLGKIKIKPLPVYPGRGAGKFLPPIGDIRIMGATATSLDDIISTTSDDGLLQFTVDQIVEIIMENARRK